MGATAPPVIGVSLKLYFGHRETLEWCERVAEIAGASSAVRDGAVDLFVIPALTEVTEAVRLFAATPVRVGAPDLHWVDRGAFTGEVSGATLAEIGVRLVEVGHAERRVLFGETERIVTDKVDAALRNGLEPVLCIGEAELLSDTEAARECVHQLRSAVARALDAGRTGRLLVAYEPRWAIGAREPASHARIRAVCDRLTEALTEWPSVVGSRVIYGGSARPGMLAGLGDSVSGLFLGRSAHDPGALEAVIQEAADRARAQSEVQRPLIQ